MESVCRWTVLACHCNVRLRPFTVASSSAKFICRASFVGWWLKPSETVDIYLASLRRLVVPFGGATDRHFSSNQSVSNAGAKNPEGRCLLFLCSFLPALICMRIFTLRGFTWLPTWKCMTICNKSLLRAAMFFFSSQGNRSCTRSICADVCTGVSADVPIFFPIFTTQSFPSFILVALLSLPYYLLVEREEMKSYISQGY